MTDVRNNGSVKWWQLITVLIPMLLAPLGYTYTVSTDSVNRYEFNQFEKRMEDKFTSMEKRFDYLEIMLREIKLDLREIKNSGERKPN